MQGPQIFIIMRSLRKQCCLPAQYGSKLIASHPSALLLFNKMLRGSDCPLCPERKPIPQPEQPRHQSHKCKAARKDSTVRQNCPRLIRVQELK